MRTLSNTIPQTIRTVAEQTAATRKRTRTEQKANKPARTKTERKALAIPQTGEWVLDILQRCPQAQTEPEFLAGSGTTSHGIGAQYLELLDSGKSPNEALTICAERARISAKNRLFNRTDTLRRPYGWDIESDVSGEVIVRLMEAIQTGDDREIRKVSVWAPFSRLDRGYNRATRYWTCKYYVRVNYWADPTFGKEYGASEHAPNDGHWVRCSQETYNYARKLQTRTESEHRWVEVLEYRKTPRVLTEADHDDSTGYTTGSGDINVWATIASLPETERTALRLYGMGCTLRIIADALFGKDKGTTEQARNIVRSALSTVRVRVEGTRDKNVTILNRPCTEQAPNFRFGKRKDSVRCYYNGTEQPTTEQIPSIRPAVSSPTTWGEQMANTHGRINRRKIAATIKYMAEYPNGKQATPV